LLDASKVDIGLDEAYGVQDRVHHRLRADSPTVGFKLGYTSQVMREAMGIDEPNHGPLTESMVVTSGTVVSGLLQPKVEPELAVFLDAQGRVERTVASLEVVDSIWQDYQFTWAHNTADGSSAAFAVLGDTMPEGCSPDTVDITLTSSDGSSSSASGNASGLDLPESLVWLANHSDLPRDLRAGDIILTGGLAKPLDLHAGGWIEAVFAVGDWTTTVRVERGAD